MKARVTLWIGLWCCNAQVFLKYHVVYYKNSLNFQFIYLGVCFKNPKPLILLGRWPMKTWIWGSINYIDLPHYSWQNKIKIYIQVFSGMRKYKLIMNTNKFAYFSCSNLDPIIINCIRYLSWGGIEYFFMSHLHILQLQLWPRINKHRLGLEACGIIT